MNDDINWDDYYNGYLHNSLEYTPEDCIVHINDIFDTSENIGDFDSVRYIGPKTNATIKQIMYYLHVKQQNSKFLYNEDTIVILLDYSEKIVDKWKNGTVLYCYGEKQYSIPNDRNRLSVIDQKLFGSGCNGDVRVYAFWKDTTKNYNFIYGILVLNREPYQITEGSGFRWVFPLSLISNKFFSMPEKYSFNIDVHRIEKSIIEKNQQQDELQLLDFNNTEHFDLSGSKPTYKGVPQEKSSYIQKSELIERSRKVSANALRIAEYKCEFDLDHLTFIRRTQNVPYTEAHHLIPLCYSNLFKYSLDIEENIVSLCSNCHNQIHYGKGSATIIKKLFAERKELLKRAGIILSEQELLSMYGLNELDE